MVELTIPDDPELVQALGRLALAHAQLEVVLKYTFKTLSGLPIKEALEQMKKNRTSFLRKRIRRLFLDKHPIAEDLAKLDTLLDKARDLSEKRNELLHSAWAVSPAGEPIVKSESYTWGPAPNRKEVERFAVEIMDLGKKINTERLHGFIRQAAHADRKGDSPLA